MRRRWPYLIILASLLLGGLGYLLCGPEPEPSYDGRTLTEWLDFRIAYSGSAYTQEKTQFTNAIAHMGTNAVPHLVKWVKYEAPSWKAALDGYLRTNYPAWNFKLRIRAKLAGSARALHAASAFEALGPRGDSAVEELRPLLTHNTDNAYYAALALAHIGPKGLPHILSVLTNQQATRPQHMIFMLGYAGSNALPALPTLIQFLQSTNTQLATSSASTLSRVQLQPDLVVPGLQAALKDSRTAVRGSVIRALGDFGTNARSAMPALREHLNDPDWSTRKCTTNALRRIDPESIPSF